uniref:hypothetical protein n=1 Tax=Paractinoplanes polyasparticus TaxID=2856853 RepID=UPI001C8480CA|nr:hypothetical protein [Actinoplanes polyasparticus]
MTWTNTKRARSKAERRRDHHEDRIKTADTSRKKLSAACGWLIAEAWQAGLTAEIHAWVLEKVHELRKEATNREHAE